MINARINVTTKGEKGYVIIAFFDLNQVLIEYLVKHFHVSVIIVSYTQCVSTNIYA